MSGHRAAGEDGPRMTDSERLDWLQEDWDRLEDVRGLLSNEPFDTVRSAIDELRQRDRA